MTRPSSTDPLIGTTIGGYKIIERLGKGGMGVVYKANQQSLDRTVALKVLSPKLAADPAFVRKFSDEAQAAGRLNHPNIVQVYDVGHDGTHHFYSMEFIEKGSVQALLDAKPGPLDLDLALAIVTDAARGLVYAEKKSIVHRDIKPDNLMINAEGVVKIADLGLALDPGRGDAVDRILGTPHYISPEQAQGLDVDSRSDLYSLGATWFRLVTGRTVFDATDVKEIVRRQIEEPAPAVRDINRDVPAPVAELIEKLLAKEPSARPASAEALLTELERWSAPKSGAGLKIALFLALAALAGGGWIMATRESPKPADPVAPIVIREGETAEEKAARERAAAERESRESTAKAAFVAAQAADNDAAKSEKPDWEPVKRLYDRVASEFPGTTSADLAANRAGALAELIAAAREREQAVNRSAESRAAAFRDALVKASEKADALAAALRFGEATAAFSPVRPLASNAGETTEVDVAVEKILKVAEGTAKDALAKAKVSESAGATDKASAQLEELAAHFGGGAPPVAARRLEPLVKALFDESAAIRRRVVEKRAADTEADVVVAFDARRTSGRLAAAFDPDRALEILQGAAKSLRLGIGADDLAADVRLVESVRRVRDRFVAYCKATPDLKLKLPNPQDRRKTLDWTVVAATPTGVTAKRGSNESAFAFSAGGAAEAFDGFFSAVPDRTPEAVRDLVAFHVWSGRPEKALDLVALLPDAAERDALVAVLRREAEAWEIWTRVRELVPRATAGDDAALGGLERASSRLLGDLASTRAALLNRRDPPKPAK